MITQKPLDDGYIELIIDPKNDLDYDLLMCVDNSNGHFILKVNENNEVEYWDVSQNDFSGGWENITDKISVDDILSYKKHEYITKATKLILPLYDKMMEEENIVEVYCFKVFISENGDFDLNDNIEKVALDRSDVSKTHYGNKGIRHSDDGKIREIWYYSTDENVTLLMLGGLKEGIALESGKFFT